MRFDYPILLDLSTRTIVIIGGGAVAARKAQGLLSAGARRVRVVAPQFHDALPSGVEHVCDNYDEFHLDGAGLVFAATDQPDVNTQVVRDAQKRGILVSRADEHDECAGDFVVPAVHRDGAVTVAVSAGSAGLSAAIRDGVARGFDPRWSRMADAMRILRPRIRNQGKLSPARRRAMFHDLATDEAFAAAVDGPEPLWKWLMARHADLAQD